MPKPTDKDARLFWTLARQRYEDGRDILEKLGRARASTYLAGYAVECALKALLICNTPVGRRGRLIASFRGAVWHNPTHLRERLNAFGVRFPQTLIRPFLLVSTWSTNLRYEPGAGNVDDAREFLDAVRSIVSWADGRMN